MKKRIILVCLLVVTLGLTGCGTDEVKELNCSRTATIAEGVDVDFSYKVTYKGDYVELVETEEKVISDDTDVLETYKTSIESIYSPYKDVEHYEYNVDISGNTLTSTTKIDYSKIDTDQLIEIDSANGTLIKDGKINIEDIRSAYCLLYTLTLPTNREV